MKAVRHISFDVWMTLLDTRVFYREIARHLAEIKGENPETVYNIIQRGYIAVKEARRRGKIDPQNVLESSFKIAQKATDGFLAFDEVAEAVSRAVNTIDPQSLVLDEAHVLLENLSKKYSLSVASNVVFWPGYITRTILAKTGLSKYFGVQVYADEVCCLKPEPCMFEKLYEKTGAEVEEWVHVGDSFREDFLGALAYGLSAILIDRNRVYARGYFKGFKACIIGSLKEVPACLKIFFGEKI
ncbi:MAG: hypothetical protein DRJ35_03400 [Thermoprotei archaeon]|nr:MAG: hypothetical protein DRJ35_03400 [Thermoprotei archaeon]